MAQTVADLVAVLRANTTDFNAKMAVAEKQLGSVGSSASNMSKVGMVAFGALSAGAVAFGTIAVKQAQEQEVATARLKQAISNIGQSYDTYGDKISKAEDAAVKLGFADDEVTQGLGKLVPATKNVGESIKLMSLAEDIARGRHIDLASATDLLVKVQTGHVALLGRIGINVKDANGQIISQEEAVKRLTAMYGGQASAYTETFAGKIAVLRQEFAQFAEKIGFILIPILTTLMGTITSVVGFFEKYKAAAVALAVIIGGPLVYAMLAFMAVKIGAFIESAVTAFVNLRAAIGSTIEAMGLMEAATLGPLLAFAGIVAAALAVGYALHLVFGSGAMQEMLDSFKKGQEEGKKFAEVLVSGAKESGAPIATMRASLEELRAKQAELTDAAHKGTVEMAAGVEAYSKNEAAIKAVKQAIADYKQQQAEAAAADRQRTADVQAVANGTTQLANATQAAKKAIQDYQNEVIAAQGGEIGRQQAILNSQQAFDDLNAAIRDHGYDSREAAAAALNYQNAQLQVTSATLSASDAQDAMNAATSKNPALVQATIAKLQEQIRAHGDATGAIQGEIDRLHTMQFTVDGLHGKQIAVTVDNYQAIQAIVDVLHAIDSIPNGVTTSLNAWVNGPTPHAAGGVFTSPHVGLVAEAGPEAIVPLNNPGRAAQVMAQAGLGGGGGGTVNNITVNAGMGADGQSIAAAIANELRIYEQRGGKVPWV